jgi:hypothetical protein
MTVLAKSSSRRRYCRAALDHRPLADLVVGRGHGACPPAVARPGSLAEQSQPEATCETPRPTHAIPGQAAKRNTHIFIS